MYARRKTADRIQTAEDGSTLSLGDLTLEFISTPWVHWPETMSTFVRERGLLLSCDFFGAHTYGRVDADPAARFHTLWSGDRSEVEA